MYKRKVKITAEPINVWNYTKKEMKLLGEIGPEIEAGRYSIKEIKDLIKKYPNLPTLYNYLTVAYEKTRNFEKVFETTIKLVEKFPDYLLGKINLAKLYINKKQFDKIPELFESFDITELYPKRNVFHESEILGFEYVKINYFLEKNEIKKARESFNFIRALNPYHYLITELTDLFNDKSIDVGEDFDYDDYKKFGKSYDKSKQTDVAPDFNHPEILNLYKYDLRIDKQLLETIINLPRKTLVEDLEKIIDDAELRYEYFTENDFEIEELYFVFHALYILGEIQSKESLPKVLDFLSFDKEFIEFWIGSETLTEDFWKIIYRLSDENNYHLLFDFLKRPNIDTIVRAVVASALINVIHYKPELRNDFVKLFKQVIAYFLENKDSEELFDGLFLTFFTGDLVNNHIHELLPEITDLYDKNIIEETIIGTLREAEEWLNDNKKIEKPKLFDSIFDEYEEIYKLWDDEESLYDDIDTKFDIFLGSLSEKQRKEFLDIFEFNLDIKFEDNLDLLADFIENLDEEQYQLLLAYIEAYRNEAVEDENTAFLEFFDSLDVNQKVLYVMVFLVENEINFIEMLELYKMTLDDNQLNLFLEYIKPLEYKIEDPKLMKFLNSINEAQRKEFFDLMKFESEEKKSKKIDKFVAGLNRKQSKYFLEYAAFIEDNFDFREYHSSEPVKKVKIGRNDPCPCGSGKKYKHCCMNKKDKPF